MVDKAKRARSESSEDLSGVFAERAKLEAQAYRFLGSVADAEDAVQETFLRWFKLDRLEQEKIEVSAAWLRTVLTRICLDRLKSLRSKREIYVGEWLPEPLPENVIGLSATQISGEIDPDKELELSDSVSMALMIVLEKMTPAERVSFILHDVFQYSFDEIGEIVGRTPQACRQLACSARKRIEKKGYTRPTREEHAKVNTAFRLAWTTGNIDAFVALLDKQSRAVTDGGGHVSAAIEPLCGPTEISEFFFSAFQRQSDLLIEETLVNGEPGLVGKAQGRTVAVISTVLNEGLIKDIWVIRNPDKLRVWL
jgi:RNA polymerase sigma-70 factor, ECF subfamily